MSDSRGWSRVAPAIAGHGYRVVAVDLPGHGAGGPAPVSTPTALAAALLDTQPGAPDVAVGHSLGSAALLLAVPGLRCARAVHCDPAWLPRPRDLNALRAGKHATWREPRAAHPGRHDDGITAERQALAGWDPASVTALQHLPGLPGAPAARLAVTGTVRAARPHPGSGHGGGSTPPGSRRWCCSRAAARTTS
ncbi:alpha/beta hydrolase [Streptomyces sp. NPDC002784]